MANQKAFDEPVVFNAGATVVPGAAGGKVAVSTASGGITWQDELMSASRLSDCANMHWHLVAVGNNATNALASGTVYGSIAVCMKAGSFTQMALFTSSTAPSAITDCRVGVWNSSGTLLQGSGNLNGTITAANTVYSTLSLGGTVTLTQGQIVYLGVAFLGTTVPTLRGVSGSGLVALTSAIVRTKNANGWAGGALPNITGTNSVNPFPWLTLLP